MAKKRTRRPLPDRVAKGIAQIVSKGPADWRGLIVLARIDMGYPMLRADRRACVLAQVFGTYRTGLAQLGVKTPRAHGYTVYFDEELGPLTREWRRQLRRISK